MSLVSFWKHKKNQTLVVWSQLITLLHFLMTFPSQHFNPFVPNVPFLYTLKISENYKVFWWFQGEEKGCFGNKWVKSFELTKMSNNFTYDWYFFCVWLTVVHLMISVDRFRINIFHFVFVGIAIENNNTYISPSSFFI